MDLRATARVIYLQTLRRLDLRQVVQRKLQRSGSMLQVDASFYDLGQFARVMIVAVGKAAVPMTNALLEALNPRPEAVYLEGIVIGSVVPGNRHSALQYHLGSHPLPNIASMENATRVLHLLRTCGRETLVFFLVSGGSSAMLECALDPAITLEEMVAFHRVLVHSGLSIAEMNSLRKHVSAVKGGRLAVAAGEATTCTLLVSDVLPGMPDVIGSGMSLPDSSTVEDCRKLLRTTLADAAVPSAIRNWFAGNVCPETPKPDHPAFRRATWHTLLSSDDLCDVASEIAKSMGFHVELDLSCDEADYREAAAYLTARLQALADRYPRVCLVSAGELAVTITGDPGTGGRNQQFALECARLLALRGGSATVLSAGSDGMDGNSPAAGAVVDETTGSRAAAQGLDIATSLAGFNSYPLLQQLGDAIYTGPTGNNLRDLRLLLAVSATAELRQPFRRGE